MLHRRPKPRVGLISQLPTPNSQLPVPVSASANWSTPNYQPNSQLPTPSRQLLPAANSQLPTAALVLQSPLSVTQTTGRIIDECGECRHVTLTSRLPCCIA
jgi:hypothetical protein